MTISVQFLDSGRTAKEKPDPRYPDGKRINLAAPEARSCTRNLPFPAPRCGQYDIICGLCGFRALITVAGRPDDPCMITLPCAKVALNG
jgi:hypothetical protein